MSDDQWRRRERDAARPVRGVRRSAVPGRGSRHRRGVRRHGGAPAELRAQRHRTAPALDRPADGRGAAHGARRGVRRRRRRRRRVVVVHDRVADLARRHRRGPDEGSERRLPVAIRSGSFDRDHDRRGPRRRAVPADVAAAVGRDPDRHAAAPRARPDHDRHRSVRRRAPPACRSQPPRRVVADARRPARRPGPHVGVAHPTAAQPAGRDRRRPRARRRVHRRHAVAAGRRRRPRHDRARHRRVRVLRQGDREGLPPGRRPGPGGVRRRAARRLLGRRRVRSRSSSRSRSSPAPPASSGRPASSPGRCRTWP